MRYLGLFLLLIFNTVLQTTLLTHFEIGGVRPNLVLIQVIFFSSLNGSGLGGAFGALAGLFLDLVSGRYIGLNALSFSAVGAVVGLVEGRLYKDNLLVPIGGVFVGSFIYNLLAFFLGTFAGLRLSFGMLLTTIFIQTLYNTALVPLLYGQFYRASSEGWLRRKEVGS